LRDCDSNNWRIFLAKLRHAPGNALTFSSLSEGRGYYVDPSDTVRSFRTFDQVFGTDSAEIFNLFTRSKQIIDETGDLPLEIAIKLLRWHDSLVATVLGHYPPALKEFFDEETGVLTKRLLREKINLTIVGPYKKGEEFLSLIH